MDWKAVLKEDLRRDEGLRLKAYRCTSGVWTIGVGHTKGVRPGDTVTEARALELLDEDMEQAIKDARKVCICFDDLNGPRKTVIANMSFNLGAVRLAGFKNTLACVCAGDFAQAALNMGKSRWATQVGQRAQRLAKRMSTGEW